MSWEKKVFLKLVQLLWHTAPIFQKFKIFGIWLPKCIDQNRRQFRPNWPNRPGRRKYTYISFLTPNHISTYAIAVAQCSCLLWARKMIPPFSGFSKGTYEFTRFLTPCLRDNFKMSYIHEFLRFHDMRNTGKRKSLIFSARVKLFF